MLHTGMLKGFMDGSLGSHTAALIEPYADDPKNSGLPQYDSAKLNEMAKERVLAGYQLGFHAIGDKGAQMALDAFAESERAAREKKVKAANGGDRLSFAYRARTGDNSAADREIPRPESDCVDAAQPLADRHELGAGPPGTKSAQHIPMRGRNSCNAASPWPSAPIIRSSRFLRFAGCTPLPRARARTASKNISPGQKITMDQAIAAYTTGSAFAEFAEKEKG